MLGHVLRMDVSTPAQKALEFAVSGSTKYKSRAGRHRTNLLSTIREDVKIAGLGELKSAGHLQRLRETAADRKNGKV